MRRFLAATVSAIVLFAAFANPLPVFATDISINGDTRTFATATVVNGVMLFPLREAFEALGFTVGWDGSTGQISLTRGDDTLLLTVGSATVTLNGTATALEAPVQIIQDGVSFMPLATVLTALGYNVETDAVAAVVDEPAQVAVEEPAIPADVVPVEMPTVDPLPGVTIETVTVEGYLGPITVQVSLQDNVPFAVEVVEHNETPPFFNMAQPATADAIVEAGTWDIYPVSGATTTSQAIIDAVRQAMEGTPVQDAVTLPAELPAEEVVEEPAEEVTEELAEEVTEEPAEEVAEEPAEEVTEESAEEVTEEPAEEVTEEPAEVSGEVVTVNVEGFGGQMTVAVTLEGNVPVAVEVVEHSETALFYNMVQPDTADAIVAAGTWDIEALTGATITSQAIIDAVRQAIEGAPADEPAVDEPTEEVTEEPVDEPTEEVTEEPVEEVTEEPAEPAETAGTFTAGTFIGSAIGRNDVVRLELEFSADEILSITVLAHDETPSFVGDPEEDDSAFATIFNQVLANQSIVAIDTHTGATITSNALIEAISNAITQALGDSVMDEPAISEPEPEEVADVEEPAEEVTEEPAEEVTEEPADVEEPAEEEPAEDAAPVAGGVGENGLPLATATFTPGTQTVSVPGWNESTMTVDVTFSENQILDVVLVDHHESTYGSGWAFRALPGVPDQIVVRQSTNDIDTFTGATSTRNSVIAAVEEAITLAGASPADLVPQTVDAPIPGDNFIPGFVEITVPANTMNQDGNPLAEGDARMLHSEDTDMNLRVSFGRNEFHIHSGGASTLGQGADAHGESIYEAGEIGGGTWGGWFFRQTAVHNFNDRQTTQGIDIATGATESASGIRWGLEQAITQQGGNPASLVARTTPRTQIQRNPSGEPTDPFFEPGVYTVTVEGRNGPMTVAVTFDRTTIRRIVVVEHTETPEYFDTVWGASADNILRDAIYQAQFAGLDDVDTVSGATLSSSAIIEAVRQAAQQAWID
ncbi:MAG: FMN-binding protein [Firmicutes bacterium]|nr:FMN-binding protein [Bacillota bacterium]